MQHVVVTERSDVTVTTPDGECPAVVVTPDGDGPWSAVILFMDAGGGRPGMVEMAEQLARLGDVARRGVARLDLGSFF